MFELHKVFKYSLGGSMKSYGINILDNLVFYYINER